MSKNLFLLLFLSIASIANNNIIKNISITNAYIRLMPPNMRMTAAFMEIKNLSNKNISIINVKSDLAKFTELHTSIIKNDGNMQMKHIQTVKLPSNKIVYFKRGGKHIMMIGLKEKLHEDDTHKITIVFSNGNKVEQLFTVKRF
jgi:copper(I)-binding protein